MRHAVPLENLKDRLVLLESYLEWIGSSLSSELLQQKVFLLNQDHM